MAESSKTHHFIPVIIFPSKVFVTVTYYFSSCCYYSLVGITSGQQYLACPSITCGTNLDSIPRVSCW